jgi:hypothetical protein
MAELELQMMWPEQDWTTIHNKYRHQLVSIHQIWSFDIDLTTIISIS